MGWSSPEQSWTGLSWLMPCFLFKVFFCLCLYAICDIKRSYRSSLVPVEKWDVKINFTQLSQRVDLFWLAIWVIVDLFVYQYWSLWVSLGRWRYEKVTKPVQSHRLLSRCKRNYQGRNYRTSRSSANTHLSQEQLVCYTAVFSVVTQHSSTLTAAENRTTFLSRD